MKTRILILLFFLPLVVVGQRPKIFFNEKAYNFGKIEASKGTVSHTFTVVNKGDVPVSIIDVDVSCGCTTPKWSDHPILPGQQGSVTVNFNPMNLSGKFSKKIFVFSTGNTVTPLKISGEVIAEAIDPEKNFPVAIGSLRMSTDSVRLDANKRSQIIQLFNVGKKNIAITSISKPGDVMIDYTPVLFLPNFRGNLVFLYTPVDGKKEKRHERVLINTNEGVMGIIHVTIVPPDDLSR
jgi:hypothetical protein